MSGSLIYQVNPSGAPLTVNVPVALRGIIVVNGLDVPVSVTDGAGNVIATAAPGTDYLGAIPTPTPVYTLAAARPATNGGQASVTFTASPQTGGSTSTGVVSTAPSTLLATSGPLPLVFALPRDTNGLEAWASGLTGPAIVTLEASVAGSLFRLIDLAVCPGVTTTHGRYDRPLPAGAVVTFAPGLTGTGTLLY